MALSMAHPPNLSEVMEEEGESGVSSEDAVDSNKYKQVLGLKEVHILALFSLIYVGVEVTMGGAYSWIVPFRRQSSSLRLFSAGWSVTYILERRNGNSNSGYIASGFFGGMFMTTAK